MWYFGRCRVIHTQERHVELFSGALEYPDLHVLLMLYWMDTSKEQLPLIPFCDWQGPLLLRFASHDTSISFAPQACASRLSEVYHPTRQSTRC